MEPWISRFEDELRHRGLRFELDSESGRHRVTAPFGSVLVSLDNLLKDLNADGDIGRIRRFVDMILSSGGNEEIDLKRLFWSLEPNDYEERAEIIVPVSDRVDRILVHLSADGSGITWVTRKMLTELSTIEAQAAEMGFQNLARELAASSVEFSEIGEVKLGFIVSNIAFKSSLILAPNVREVVESVLGWPILAVAPDRGFLYLWAAKHRDFVGRVGRTVVKEYSKASYPISTEVYLVSDEGLKAIGEFPTGA